MAHDLEQYGDDVAFALRGEPAWHGLASVIFDEDAHITTADMLKSAHLNDWNVSLEEVTFPAGYRPVTPAFAVTRTNPFDGGTDVLGVVGDRYKVMQNEELFSFGDNLTDGGAEWESAGSIKKGRQVFGALTLPSEFILDPQGIADKTKSYLLVTTSHDGSASITACVTPVRVVCQNTLNMALNGSKQQFKIRHTQKADGRVEEARRILGLSVAHMDNFSKVAEELFQTSITNAQFDKIVEALYPAPDADAKGALTMHTKKVDLIKALYLNSPTQQGITGTAWGALNALTERVDYFRNGRGNTEGLMASASGFEAGVNAEKARILSAVRELASA
jgi:phage/plasmid-like protein (TIGR03299 family)